MSTPTRVTALLGALAFAGTVYPAIAADYPERALTLIVPYPPGASTDSLARVTATELGKVLGQSVVVENRPGGETTIATLAAKRAPADGYTLLFQTTGLVQATYALKNPGYEVSDFVPVSGLIKTPFVLMVPSTLPSQSVDEFFAYARQHSSKLNHGTLGAGPSGYKVMGDAIQRAGKFTWTDIPYKGGMEGVQAVMSGQIHGYFATVSLAVSQQYQPSIRLLAVTDTKRSAYLPNVPTFDELGYPDLVNASHYGIYVRKEVAQPIRVKLEAALRDVMKSEAMKASIASLSLEPFEGSLQDYKAEVQTAADKFAADVKRLGLEPK